MRACVRRRIALRRVASRRVARRRGDSAWHDHEKFRRSRSTFARRSKNLSHSLFHDTADGELGRRPSALECCTVSRAAPSPSLPIDNERLWPRKSFSSTDFREKTTGEMEPRFVAKPLVLHRFLFETDRRKIQCRKNSTTRQGFVKSYMYDYQNRVLLQKHVL